MSLLTFPTAAVIANTVPLNGNTVPITGTNAITNHSELLLYSALSFENIYLSDNVIFPRGTMPTMQINKAVSTSGDIYLEIWGYIKMKSNYATFPDNLKLHKQCVERLPNNPANVGFNF